MWPHISFVLLVNLFSSVDFELKMSCWWSFIEVKCVVTIFHTYLWFHFNRFYISVEKLRGMEPAFHTLLWTFPPIPPSASLSLEWVCMMRVIVQNGYIWTFLCSEVDQENSMKQFFGVPIPNRMPYTVLYSILEPILPGAIVLMCSVCQIAQQRSNHEDPCAKTRDFDELQTSTYNGGPKSNSRTCSVFETRSSTNCILRCSWV